MERSYIDLKSARQIEIENEIWRDNRRLSGPQREYVDLTSLLKLYWTEQK